MKSEYAVTPDGRYSWSRAVSGDARTLHFLPKLESASSES